MGIRDRDGALGFISRIEDMKRCAGPGNLATIIEMVMVTVMVTVAVMVMGMGMGMGMEMMM